MINISTYVGRYVMLSHITLLPYVVTTMLINFDQRVNVSKPGDFLGFTCFGTSVWFSSAEYRMTLISMGKIDCNETATQTRTACLFDDILHYEVEWVFPWRSKISRVFPFLRQFHLFLSYAPALTTRCAGTRPSEYALNIACGAKRSD